MSNKLLTISAYKYDHFQWFWIQLPLLVYQVRFLVVYIGMLCPSVQELSEALASSSERFGGTRICCELTSLFKVLLNSSDLSTYDLDALWLHSKGSVLNLMNSWEHGGAKESRHSTTTKVIPKWSSESALSNGTTTEPIGDLCSEIFVSFRLP